MKQTILIILLVATIILSGCTKEGDIPVAKNLTIDEAHGCNISQGKYYCASNNSCYEPVYGPCSGQPIPPGSLDGVPHFDYRG